MSVNTALMLWYKKLFNVLTFDIAGQPALSFEKVTWNLALPVLASANSMLPFFTLSQIINTLLKKITLYQLQPDKLPA